MANSQYVPQKFPHQWLPEKIELKTWDQIEPWYRNLLDMSIASAGDLEQWLVAAGELNAAVGQEGVARYVAMTCQTDDPEREAAYLSFIREIEPKLKPLQNDIRNMYLDSPYRSQLDAQPLCGVHALWRTVAPCSERRTFPARPGWPSSSSSIRRPWGP